MAAFLLWGASTLPGPSAACINWPFLQVWDKDNKGKLIIIQSMLKPQERIAIDNCVCIVAVIPFNTWTLNEISIINRPHLNVWLQLRCFSQKLTTLSQITSSNDSTAPAPERSAVCAALLAVKKKHTDASVVSWQMDFFFYLKAHYSVGVKIKSAVIPQTP